MNARASALVTERVHHDPLAAVRSALEAWARMCARSDRGGYPPHSWEGRAQLRGGARPQVGVYVPLADYSDPLAEAVDRHVAAMPGRLRTVVVLEYRWGGTQPQRAVRAGCGLSAYKTRLGEALWWLHGRMGERP